MFDTCLCRKMRYNVNKKIVSFNLNFIEKKIYANVNDTLLSVFVGKLHADLFQDQLKL